MRYFARSNLLWGGGLTTLAKAVMNLFANNEEGAWYDPSDINIYWRKNLLVYSEQFENVVNWSNSGGGSTITVNADIAPDGTNTAELISTPNNTSQGVFQNFAVTPGVTYTFSFYAKRSTQTAAEYRLYDNTMAMNIAQASYYSLINSSTYTRVSFTYTAGPTTTSVRHYVQADGATVGQALVKGAYIWGAMLNVGSTALGYQRIIDGAEDYFSYSLLPTMYQDSVGTTPVSGIEQPVGLRLDKRKGLVIGPELVTNGDFSNGTTGWTQNATGSPSMSVVNGQVVCNSGTVSNALIQSTALSTVAGRWYKVTVDKILSTTALLYAGTTLGSANLANSGNLTTSGPKTIIFLATTSTSFFTIAGTTVNSTGTFDNISIKEIAGNHAFQATNASRAVLSARVNMTTKSEQINDTAWTKLSAGTGTAPVVTANYSVAPDGNNTADRVQMALNGGTTSTDQSSFYQIIPIVSGASYTIAIWLKTNDGSTKSVQFRDDNGSVVNQILTVTPTWTRFTFAGTSVTATCNFRLWLRGAQGTSDSADLSVWASDLRPTNQVTSTIPTYQRVNTSTDYDTVGFPLYLKYDGVDDFYQTASLNFTGTNTVTLCAGMRKLSDALTAIIVEFSATSTSNPGSFYMAGPISGTNTEWGFQANGANVLNTRRYSPYTAPVSSVLSALLRSTAADSVASQSVRINGVAQVGTISATGNATGNFGNYPLFIGARAGTSFRYSGQEYGLILRVAQSLPSQVEDLERYITSKM